MTVNKTGNEREPEEWRSVPNYLGEYEVSNHGRVRSLTKSVSGHNGIKVRIGKVLKPAKRNNYFFVKLSSGNVSKAHSIHVLTAKVFVDNPYNKPTVNHEDGDKENNYYKNLSWATSSEQIKHAIRIGLITPHPPTKKGDKLSDETRRKMSISRIRYQNNKQPKQ